MSSVYVDHWAELSELSDKELFAEASIHYYRNQDFRKKFDGLLVNNGVKNKIRNKILKFTLKKLGERTRNIQRTKYMPEHIITEFVARRAANEQ